MSNRPTCLERAVRHVDCRLQGLLSEFSTLKDRWGYINRILEYPNILPDIFAEGEIDSDIGFYYDYCKRRINAISRMTQDSEFNMYRAQRYLHEVKDLSGKLARMLTLVKAAFYQRTDAIDIPYVIANVPISPERSWGNELYLLAADNLVRNYLEFVNLHQKKWDCFVSYAPTRTLLDESRGGVQISFHRTFHLELSEDAKYDLRSFSVLAHELGHAVCYSTFKKVKGKEIFSPVYRFLWVFYNLVQKMSEILEECQKQKVHALDSSKCILQQLDYLFQLNAEHKQKYSRNDFIREMFRSPLLSRIDQTLADIVAIILSGPHYVGTLASYVYDSILLPERGNRSPTPNVAALFEMVLRINCCHAFAHAKLSGKFVKESSETLRSMNREMQWSIRDVREMKLVSEDDLAASEFCVACAGDIGWLIGECIARSFDKIFHDVLAMDAVFITDDDLVRKLHDEEVVAHVEPRKILDAYLELSDFRKNLTCPAALFSMASERSIERT